MSNNEDFGYSKITIERHKLDEDGKVEKKNKKPVPDPSKRDTEGVPLTEDINEYFEREVIPYAEDAWIDKNKTKIGYEIPFTRYFYKYIAPPKADDIMKEILQKEDELNGSLKELFENE